MQTLDVLTLKHLATELAGGLTGAKIQKIQQAGRMGWVLQLWYGHTACSKPACDRLYIDLNPQHPLAGLFMLEQIKTWSPEFLPTPTGFCMLLRKYLTGARILAVKTLPGERVLNLELEIVNELGNRQPLTLSAELMGKHSNLLLVDRLTDTVLGLSHPVTAEMSQHRTLFVGKPYQPPPRDVRKRLFLALTEEEFVTLWVQAPPDDPLPALRHALWGLHWPLFEELLKQCQQQGLAEGALGRAVYQAWLQIEFGKELQPALSADNSRWSLWPHLEGHAVASPWQPMTSISAMMQTYYAHHLAQGCFQAEKTRLLTWLNKQHARLKTRQTQLAEVSEADIRAAQHLGDLLLSQPQLSQAGLYQAGQTTLTLEDFETGQPVEIMLNPALSWVENAQRYYQKAKKLRARQAVQQAQSAQLADEAAYLAELHVLVTQATSQTELEALQADLAALGFRAAEGLHRAQQKTATGKKWAKKPTKTPVKKQSTGVLKLLSSDGGEIWVGKSGQGNQALLSKFSQPEDLWLHVHQQPGSHVLLKAQNQAVSDKTLLEAAMLAVYFSAARGSKNVPVIYTPVRFVRSIPNSYPGHVTYKHEQTVFITVDAEKIGPLLV